MPFSDSGLARYSGVNMTLAFEKNESEGELHLKINNPEPIETKLLHLDVIEKNDIAFELTVKYGADDVAVTIKGSVKMARQKEKAASMLSGALAVADLLEKKFPNQK